MPSRPRHTRCLLLLLSACLAPVPIAFADEGAASAAPRPAWHLDLGEGDGIRRISGGLSWPGWTDIPCERGCRAELWWLVRAARWWQPRYQGPHQDVWDFSATPVLRIGSYGSGTTRFFLEAGAGFHLLSDQNVGPTRGFGSSFQFGETLAAGVEFGEHHEQALAARLEHVSNGGLEDPNNGITFFVLEYRHAFR